MILIPAVVTDCAICQTCWGQSCYYVASISIMVQFSVAKQRCWNLGGRLVEVETSEESNFVIQLATGKCTTARKLYIYPMCLNPYHTTKRTKYIWSLAVFLLHINLKFCCS